MNKRVNNANGGGINKRIKYISVFVCFVLNFNYPKHIFNCSKQGVKLMMFFLKEQITNTIAYAYG